MFNSYAELTSLPIPSIVSLMDQLPLFQTPEVPYSVSEVNAHLRDLMEADNVLQDLWIKGEVSNLSQPKSGHLYFTLKDSGASIRCVMWRNSAMRMVYRAQDGDQIEVHGSVSVYEVGGQYQLYADQIRPAGQGSLYQEFQKLKEKLEKEGLFEADRKRPIPASPKHIGIVTSPSGAALRDILNTIRRRYPLTQVILSPATVQGSAASEEIIAAIDRLNQFADPDVILLARGGGSIEDLSAFNDESLARKIIDSKTPVICGVGHEIDFTIADFVADLRAATPTAAAELATPDKDDILANIAELQGILKRLIYDQLQESRWSWKEISNRLSRRSPKNRLLSDRQHLDELIGRAKLNLSHQVELQREKLKGLSQHLEALSPENVLERGFAVITNKKGKLVKSIKQVAPGDEIHVNVSDGEFDTQVK